MGVRPIQRSIVILVDDGAYVALLSNGVNRAVQAWKPMDGQVHPAGGT